MRNRMSATSLLANASTDKPTGCARVFRYIFENPGCNYKQIASALRMPAATVTGRVNELMYDLQYIRIVTVVDNMQLYRVRAAGEPLNHRSKSPAEVLQDKLDAVCVAYGIEPERLHELYMSHIESKLQLKLAL